MADDFRVSLIGELNEVATRKEIQKSLKKIEDSVGKIDVGKLSSMNKSLDTSRVSTSKLNKEVVKYNSAINKVTKTQNNLNKATKEGAKAAMSFGEQTFEAAKKFAIWSGVTSSYFFAIRALKDLVVEVKSLDDALVEMAKVSELSGEALEKFGDKAADVGRKINATASQVVQAAADFSRMGFSEDESLRLAEDALVLTKIADGITEVDDATLAIIATLKGFNMNASESRHILDALNEVSNNYAINTDDLADGLRRTAGVMAQSNTSFEETIGLLTAGQESLQNIEKQSSGLITISTRLRRVSEDTEDMNGLMVNLDEAFRQYTDGAVRITDANGAIRSTYDVLVDLANVWDTLDDKTQSYLGFLASGTRQSPVLTATLSNLKTMVDATSTAYGSANSAQIEFEKVMDSIQGKMDKFGATWSRIATETLDSDFVKTLLDVGDALSRVIEAVGLLNTVLLVLMATMSGKTLAILPSITLGFAGVAESIGLASGAAITFGSIMSGLLVGGAIIGGVYLLQKALDDTNETLDRANISVEESVKNWKDLNEAQKENARINAQTVIEELSGTVEKFEDAQKRLESAKENLATTTSDLMATEYATLIETIRDEIEDLQPEMDKYNRAQKVLNGSYDEGSKLIRGLIDKTKEYAQVVGDVLEELKTFRADSVTLKDALQDLANSGEIADETLVGLAENQKFVSQMMNMTEDEIIQLAKAWGLSADNMVDINKYLTNSMIQETRKRLLILLEEQQALEQYAASDEFLFFGDPKDVERSYNSMGSAIRKALLKLPELESRLNLDFEPDKIANELSGAIKEVTESYEDLTSQIESENIKAIERYRDTIIEALDEEKEALDRNKDAWERDFEDRKLASDRYYEDLMDSLDSETDTLKDNRDIQDEIATIQEKQLSLMKLQDELLDAKNQRNVRILTASGWQWIANPDEIKRINDEISSVEDELAQAKLDQERANQDRAREATKRHYEQQKLIAQRAFEDEKLIVERGYEDQFNIIDDYLDEIKDLELTNYNARLMDLNNFVNSYNSKMASIGSTSTISGGMNPSFQSSGGAPTNAKQSTIQQMKLNSAQWSAASPEEKKRLANENLRLGSELGWTRNSAGVWIDEKGQRAYATGGVNDYTGTAMLHGTKARPELVLNNAQSAGLFNFIKGLSGFNSNMLANKTPVSSGGTKLVIENINLPNVKDSRGFIAALQRIESTGGGI